MPLALWALTISAFAIGTTEFVIVGLISTIATQLGIDIPAAGLLVTFYAVGVAIGAPILTALTSRIPRRNLMIGLMFFFTLGNLMAWLAPSFNILLSARFITGLSHGVFFSVGATIATSLVSKEKGASAIALMFGGLTVALVVGVPLGTLIGQTFGWQASFLMVSLLGAISVIALFILLPKTIKNRNIRVSLMAPLRVLREPRLLLIYMITILGYGGAFAAFTFLTPLMQELAGYSEHAVSFILLAFGIAVMVGNIWGGKLADRLGAVTALKRIFSALSIILLILQFTVTSPILSVITVVIMGIFFFGNVPALQVYVVQKAVEFTPDSIDVASGLNIAAFNVGIALGSTVGSTTLIYLGLAHTPWVSAVIVASSIVLVYLCGYLDQRIEGATCTTD